MQCKHALIYQVSMFYEVKFNIVVVIVVFAYPVSRMRRSVPKEIKEDNTAELNFLQANHVLFKHVCYSTKAMLCFIKDYRTFWFIFFVNIQEQCGGNTLSSLQRINRIEQFPFFN